MAHPSVLHLVSWFPSSQNPKLGNFVENHILFLDRISHNVVLHCSEAKKRKIAFSKKETHTLVQIHFRPLIPVLSMLLAQYKGYRLLVKKGYQFNLYHLHVCYPAGIILTFLPKRPLVITEHASKFLRESKYKWSLWEKWVSKLILRSATRICPVSQSLAESIQLFSKNLPLQCIPNSVNTQLFNLPTNHGQLSKSSFRFLHISSLEESSKNISGILGAFAQILPHYPQATLAIGGDGDIEALQAKIKHFGLAPAQVEVLTAMEPLDVAAQMQRSDCFVLFSHFETQSIVLLEALACGIPVIAPAVGGIPEFVNTKNGILVKPGHSQELIEAIKQMLKGFAFDPRATAQNIAERYSPASIAESYRKVYLNALPEKP